MSDLFKRQTLDQLCEVPDEIIDVYVVERHIWQGGTVDAEAESKKKRRAEPRTAKDFLIDPVRSRSSTCRYRLPFRLARNCLSVRRKTSSSESPSPSCCTNLRFIGAALHRE